ncbi:MAG: hypothetical protein AAFN50_04265, partial [Pseudomonadota bacterium]
MSTKKKNLVVGLGKTGLSIARYLKRADANAIFFDSREQPPGLDELKAIYPDAEVLLGDAELPSDVDRVVASPGVPDSQPLLSKAIAKKLEIVSDIELFTREATVPFVSATHMIKQCRDGAFAIGSRYCDKPNRLHSREQLTS